MTIADQILYEDNHLLALNKLPGQIAQGDKTGDTPLADLVKAYIKERDFQKRYWAVVKEAPAEPVGTLEDWLVKDEAQNKSRVVPAGTKGAKQASLDYRLLGVSDGGYHLLEVNLHTGRHHQIRCQLAHIGCYIKGDLKYGAPRSNPDGSISLHARQVSFSHPVTHSQTTITAPCPDIERMFNIANE